MATWLAFRPNHGTRIWAPQTDPPEFLDFLEDAFNTFLNRHLT